jgi:hypothetical protein
MSKKNRNAKTTTKTMMTMPTEQRVWLKDQIRAIERGELDDKKRMLIVELMENARGFRQIECAEILAEVQAEEKEES